MNRPTRADARAFGRYVRKWQNLLNLRDWRVVPRRSRATGGVMADVVRSLEDRLASYRLGDTFGSVAVTPHSLEATALHEMLHVLLHELVETARAPETTDERLMSAEHRVINVLERLLLPESDPDAGTPNHRRTGP